jgi:molybdopterin-biosynthesis enzyme MoeA-like protein
MPTRDIHDRGREIDMQHHTGSTPQKGQAHMTSERSETAVRDELRRVEEQQAELRRTAQELRRQIAERADAPRDEVDVAAELTTAEELEALIAKLEDRRQALCTQLGGA